MSATIRSASSNNVKSKLVMQPGGTITFNRDGSVTATENYACIFSLALSLAPLRYVTPHPNYSSLLCDSVTVERVSGDMARVRVDYVGDPAAYYGGYSNTPTPLFTLVIETGEQPIETFYKDGTTNFNSIATTANGAVLGANGLFAGWKASSQYVGITSYLKPQIIWRMESFKKTAPTSDELNTVGKIDKPTGNANIQPPSPGGSYNWLLRSYDYQFQGAIYRYKKEWLLSGPRGWNSTIYGP